MEKNNLKDISSKMRNLSICMMTTHSRSGVLASRPMSNNGDVEYDGNSYFFTYKESDVVEHIEVNENVNLSFCGQKNLYISVVGKANLIQDKIELKEHWVKELNNWFKDGIETPGITMIHVKASTIKYWQGEDEGEVNFISKQKANI